ncbi:MAG: PrsW family intramembrane metalloprotease [Anaerolineales bacterium]
MALLLSCFLGLIPMLGFALYVNWLDRYEKEPKVLLAAAFLWGAIIAAGLAFVINTLLGIGIYLITFSTLLTEWSSSIVVAPFVEEGLKGLALLILFLAFRKEFDSLLDGAIYGGMIGLGFGATENFYYIYAYGYEEQGWVGLWMLAFIRIVLVGWQHAFYTAFSGMGFAWARLQRSFLLRLLGILTGFSLAILTHALHNTLAALADFWLVVPVDWLGWLGMLILLIFLIRHEQHLLKVHLAEEVSSGLLTPQEYATATSSLAQSKARFQALTHGNLRRTARFYQLCAELAHKKEQFRRVGDEQGNLAIIESLRQELSTLSGKVSTA